MSYLTPFAWRNLDESGGICERKSAVNWALVCPLGRLQLCKGCYIKEASSDILTLLVSIQVGFTRKKNIMLLDKLGEPDLKAETVLLDQAEVNL